MKELITLDEFIIQQQKDFPNASGELSGLLRDIGLACKIISREVNKAGINDIIGLAGNQNASGEAVQKLDLLADDLLINALKNSGECCGIASEENDEFVPIQKSENAKYVVLFDPLDGSSNIDVNVSIGTIFSIYKRKTNAESCQLEDFTQKGTEQIAAGYVLYGSSTMLVYTTGNGVNGFTLDVSIGEFCLSHRNIRIPDKTGIYSVNHASFPEFDTVVQDFIQNCIRKKMKFRYVGSMVADVHRTLIKGGIFMYPSSISAPKGKLRLLYECNPMAFIVEQAGGSATNGHQRIMELSADELHQRTAVFLGTSSLVDQIKF